MKAPARRQTVITEGLVDRVVDQLKSRKQAGVCVVRRGDEIYRAARRGGTPATLS